MRLNKNLPKASTLLRLQRSLWREYALQARCELNCLAYDADPQQINAPARLQPKLYIAPFFICPPAIFLVTAPRYTKRKMPFLQSKTRNVNQISVEDLRVSKSIVHDFDGSMAADSYIPRRFSVKQMPLLPAYEFRTGQILSGRKVQSTPQAHAPPAPMDTSSSHYSDTSVNTQRQAQAAPEQERYSSYSSASSALIYSPNIASLPQPSHEPETKFRNPYQSLNVSYSYSSRAPYKNIPAQLSPERKGDRATVSLSLKQSSTFDEILHAGSNSSLPSKSEQVPISCPSYMNSLIHVYLAEDSESCPSVNVNDTPEPVAQPVQHPTQKVPSAPTLSNASRLRNIPHTVCLDGGADYQASRFMIPARERLQSKRYPFSQNCTSVFMEPTSSTSSLSFEQPKRRPQKPRWSYMHPPKEKWEKELPLIQNRKQRHSSYTHTSNERVTLTDKGHTRLSMFSNHSGKRSVSNPIHKIKKLFGSSGGHK